jgi:hypothetical protein
VLRSIRISIHWPLFLGVSDSLFDNSGSRFLFANTFVSFFKDNIIRAADMKPVFVTHILNFIDLLCGLVVRVPGYRSRGPVSIPEATRFSEK